MLGPGTLREVALGPGPCLTWSEGQVPAAGFYTYGWSLRSLSDLFSFLGLHKRTNAGWKRFVIVAVDAKARRRVLGVNETGVRILSSRCVTLGEFPHLSEAKFPPL